MRQFGARAHLLLVAVRLVPAEQAEVGQVVLDVLAHLAPLDHLGFDPLVRALAQVEVGAAY